MRVTRQTSGIDASDVLTPCTCCSASTIPYWSVVVASLLALLATVAAGELWAGRRRYADLSDALAAALHFTIDGISAFAVAGMMTQVGRFGGSRAGVRVCVYWRLTAER